jgi:hypothetical protein
VFGQNSDSYLRNRRSFPWPQLRVYTDRDYTGTGWTFSARSMGKVK